MAFVKQSNSVRALRLLAFTAMLVVGETQQEVREDAKERAEPCDRERSRLARELLNQVILLTDFELVQKITWSTELWNEGDIKFVVREHDNFRLPSGLAFILHVFLHIECQWTGKQLTTRRFAGCSCFPKAPSALGRQSGPQGWCKLAVGCWMTLSERVTN